MNLEENMPSQYITFAVQLRAWLISPKTGIPWRSTRSCTVWSPLVKSWYSLKRSIMFTMTSILYKTVHIAHNYIWSLNKILRGYHIAKYSICHIQVRYIKKLSPDFWEDTVLFIDTVLLIARQIISEWTELNCNKHNQQNGCIYKVYEL